MQVGKQRYRVKVLSTAAVDDGAGGTIEDGPVEVGAPWASIEPLSSKEQERYASLEVKATHRVTFRPTTVKSGDILEFRGRRLRVQTVTDMEERGRWLELICEEIKKP